MTFPLQSFVGSSLDQSMTWDIALHGPAVDDRGLKAVEIAKAVSRQSFDVSYDPDELVLNLAGTPEQLDLLEQRFVNMNVKSVYLEATTLGFAEMLLAVKASRNAGVSSI